MKFLELGVNRKVVGIVKNYLRLKFQPNIFTRSQENAKKTSFFDIFLDFTAVNMQKSPYNL